MKNKTILKEFITTIKALRKLFKNKLIFSKESSCKYESNIKLDIDHRNDL